MNYVLMHKTIPVAGLDLDPQTGTIRKISELYAPEHLPVGTPVRKGAADRAFLNEWWTSRSIPSIRDRITEALERMGIPATGSLLAKGYGLSLSDAYWVCPEGSGLTWEGINFFDHPFSEDVGNALLGRAAYREGFDFSSPDNTTDGQLPKRWMIRNGKRCLVKGGSLPYFQQPYNEAIASVVMKRLGIRHVPYSLTWEDGQPYSICEDIASPNAEMVSAWYVLQTQKRSNSTSLHQHYLGCCRALGIESIQEDIDRMIVLDYIIANEDRHLNNFGLLRDANTLEWIGTTPVYDSGTSLWYDRPADRISPRNVPECKPFRKRQEDQLELVSSFRWFDASALDWIAEDIQEILSAYPRNTHMSEKRKEAISRVVQRRAYMVEDLALKREHTFPGVDLPKEAPGMTME